MIHQVYAVFDHAAKAFLPPFLLRNDGQATRAFSDAVNSKNHQFNEHPGDYNLFLIGTFDDTTAVFSGREPGPKNLGGGFLFLKVQRVDNQELPFDQLQPQTNGIDTEATQ